MSRFWCSLLLFAHCPSLSAFEGNQWGWKADAPVPIPWGGNRTAFIWCPKQRNQIKIGERILFANFMVPSKKMSAIIAIWFLAERWWLHVFDAHYCEACTGLIGKVEKWWLIDYWTIFLQLVDYELLKSESLIASLKWIFLEDASVVKTR